MFAYVELLDDYEIIENLNTLEEWKNYFKNKSIHSFFIMIKRITPLLFYNRNQNFKQVIAKNVK